MVVVEKHRAPQNIFQYKYSVSITYLYNIFLDDDDTADDDGDDDDTADGDGDDTADGDDDDDIASDDDDDAGVDDDDTAGGLAGGHGHALSHCIVVTNLFSTSAFVSSPSPMVLLRWNRSIINCTCSE